MTDLDRLPAAILFDLDDTLVDTSLSATRVWDQTAAAFADEIGHRPEEFQPVLNASRKWYWGDAKRNQAGRLDVQQARVEVTHHGLLQLGIDDRGLATRFAEYYSAHRVATMAFFPGAEQTLRFFCDAGVPLALITNGDARGQRDKVEYFELARYFRAVLIEGELGFGKPDPRVYEQALAACGVPAAGAWCVGDNLLWEVAAAQALGLRGVWNDWAGVGLPADTDVHPDRTVRRVAELVPLPGSGGAQ